MSDITAVMDEYAAGQVFAKAQSLVGTVSNNGSTSFGPFNTSYGASAWFSGGSLKLQPPNVVQIQKCSLNYKVHFTLSFDLSNIIPNIHFPGFTIKIGKWIKIKIPGFTINWPNVNIPISYQDKAQFSANFSLFPHLVSSNWKVDMVLLSVPSFQLSLAAAAILSLIGAAAAVALVGIPFIGPFLGAAILGITNTIGIAGVTNLLGIMLTPLVSGTTFTLYNQPKHFPILPPAAPDPAVFVELDQISAAVINAGEPEMVLGIDISAP
jgi:hypothetical protein